MGYDVVCKFRGKEQHLASWSRQSHQLRRQEEIHRRREAARTARALAEAAKPAATLKEK